MDIAARKRTYTPLVIAAVVLSVFVLPLAWVFYAQNRPATLAISTGQEDGVYDPMARSIGEVVTEAFPNIDFEYAPGEGSVESMERITSGACDLALLQNGTPGGKFVRTIAPLYEEILHVLVPAGANYAGLDDLRGPNKRLAIGPMRSGTQQLVKPLFEHFGLNKGEFKPEYLDMKAACERLREGKLDAVFVVAGLKPEAVRDAIATGEVKLMSLGEPGEVGSELDGFLLSYPFAHAFTIPRSTYGTTDDDRPGIPEQPISTIAVRSLLVCRQDLDHRIIYRVTRALFENRVALIHKQTAAAQIVEPTDRGAFSYPFHSGAEAYYRRHEPSFLVSYAEVMALILSIAIALGGLLAAARNWVSQTKKDRIDHYYLKLDGILSRVNSGELEGEALAEIRRELLDMRHDAVQQLADEKLSPNESFRIFQGLLADCERQVAAEIADLP